MYTDVILAVCAFRNLIGGESKLRGEQSEEQAFNVGPNCEIG